MGNFGAAEILVIAIFGLLIFGPKRLPEIARSIGRAMGEFRRAAREFTEELESGMNESERSADRAPDWDLRPGPRD